MSGATERTTTSHHTFISALQKEILNFEWKINNFDNIRENQVSLKTQTICLKSQDRSEWHLSIAAEWDKQEFYDPPPSETDIIIFCELKTKLSQQIVHWDIGAAGENGLIVSTFMAPTENQGRFGVTMKGSRDGDNPMLYRIGKCRNPRLVRGALNLVGTLTIFSSSLQQSTCPRLLSEMFEKQTIIELANDMDSLQKPGDNFSDVEICTEDGTVIPAHRAILAGRSEYFKTMFNCGLQEQNTGKVIVKEINGKAMKALIHFLYTGRLQEDWSNPEVLHDFTRAAHLYQAKRLVEFLDENIAKVCNSNSAGRLLLLCKTLEMKTAEKELRQFIKNGLKQCGEDESGLDDLLILLAEKQNV